MQSDSSPTPTAAGPSPPPTQHNCRHGIIAKIDRLHRDQNFHAQRGNDHDAPFSARTILANVEPSVAKGIRATIPPTAISKSAPGCIVSGGLAGSVGASNITGTKPRCALDRAAASRPSPTKQLLRGNPVTTSDLRRHRARRQRLLDDPSPIVGRPSPPPPGSREHLHPASHARVRLKLMVKHSHVPISKSQIGF